MLRRNPARADGSTSPELQARRHNSYSLAMTLHSAEVEPGSVALGEPDFSRAAQECPSSPLAAWRRLLREPFMRRLRASMPSTASSPVSSSWSPSCRSVSASGR